MKVHAIRTGTVQVRERQRAGAGRGLIRFGNTLLDREWSHPLPIHVWAIEHPEGVIVVDTGETARAAEDGYFPRWHPYFRLAVRERVAAEDEVGPRLRAIGIRPDDVRTVIMTHLHTDHAGGLAHFPQSEILVERREYEVASGWLGQIRGYLPHRWPAWFRPTLVEPRPGPLGPFPASHPVTRAGDVRIVPTPGHTAGHVSVVVDEGDRLLFLAGDASYTESNLVAGVVDGVAPVGGGEAAAERTLARIRDLAKRRPVVYLPSHDPESAERLETRRPVAIETDGGRAA